MSIRTPIDTKQLLRDAIAMVIAFVAGIGALIYVLANHLDY
jgi:preprotein translocase subunit SecE